MKSNIWLRAGRGISRSFSRIAGGVLLVALLLCGTAVAGPQEMGMPIGQSGAADPSLSDELTELRAKVARLEAALDMQHQGTQPNSAHTAHSKHGQMGKPGMSSMGNSQMGGMGMDGMMGSGMMNMMQMMHGGGMGMMGGMGMGRDKMQMGSMPMSPMMGQMGAGAMLSSLPGFPGASHIYHIGATNFFLDHPQHVTLSAEQQERLGKIREQSMMKQGEYSREVEEAEEELWELTASDQPSLREIEKKVREIERKKSEARIAFIKAVGDAASVLTDEQRAALLGQASPAGMQGGSGGMSGMGHM